MNINKHHKEIFLIFMAVFLQLISDLSYNGINTQISEKAMVTGLGDDFVHAVYYLDRNLWISVSALAKLAGAYVFGKWAIKIGIEKALFFVSVLFFVANSLFAVFFNILEDIMSINHLAYFFRWVICFLEPVMYIFSGIYLYQKCPKNTWIFISALIAAAIYISTYASAYLMNKLSYQMWCIFPIITSLSALIIFATLGKNSVVKKTKSFDLPILPNRVKNLAIAFGAVWATIICYRFTFLRNYMLDVKIIDMHSILSPSISILILTIFLFVELKLYKLFGFYKTAISSLLILIFIVCIPVHISGDFFIYYRILYNCAAGIFIAPLFLVLYQVMRPYENVFHHVCWFFLGYALCVLLAVVEKQTAKFFGFYHAGWYVYAASMVLFLVAMFRCKDLFIGALPNIPKRQKSNTTALSNNLDINPSH